MPLKHLVYLKSQLLHLHEDYLSLHHLKVYIQYYLLGWTGLWFEKFQGLVTEVLDETSETKLTPSCISVVIDLCFSTFQF